MQGHGWQEADGKGGRREFEGGFMRALGLMNTVGDDGKYSAIFKAHWVSRYVELKSYQPRNAFKTLQGEMAAAGVDPMPSRSTVNAWVDHSNVCKRPS